MIAFNDYLRARRAHIETLLEQQLPPATGRAKNLHEAMRYAVLGGGKRLRPLLVYLTGEALGVKTETLDAPACAVELIHAYSLAHDDLPAMDDDDLRRGKPSCHKAFGEATTILAGDALQTLAFELLAQPQPSLSAAQNLQMIRVLATASGFAGMAGGQTLDLLIQGKLADEAYIEEMHQLKTGALICASVDMGLIAAGNPDHEKISALRRYAQYFGLAFQIQDDIHDIESDVTSLGKTPGKDQKNLKPTYPAIIGLEAAKAQVASLHCQAKTALECLGTTGDYLNRLTHDILRI